MFKGWIYPESIKIILRSCFSEGLGSLVSLGCLLPWTSQWLPFPLTQSRNRLTADMQHKKGGLPICSSQKPYLSIWNLTHKVRKCPSPLWLFRMVKWIILEHQISVLHVLKKGYSYRVTSIKYNLHRRALIQYYQIHYFSSGIWDSLSYINTARPK